MNELRRTGRKVARQLFAVVFLTIGGTVASLVYRSRVEYHDLATSLGAGAAVGLVFAVVVAGALYASWVRPGYVPVAED